MLPAERLLSDFFTGGLKPPCSDLFNSFHFTRVIGRG
jgi:hypothetical protein